MCVKISKHEVDELETVRTVGFNRSSENWDGEWLGVEVQSLTEPVSRVTRSNVYSGRIRLWGNLCPKYVRFTKKTIVRANERPVVLRSQQLHRTYQSSH